MKPMSMVGIAAVILLLAAGAGAASGYELKLEDLNLATTLGTGDIPLTLDSAPDGLSGYSITFHISSSDAVITQVNFPAWASDSRFYSVTPGTNDVTIRVADVADAIKPMSTPPQGGISLGSVTVQGITKDSSSEITVIVNQMDADNGAVILPTVVKGTINVELAPGSINVMSTGAAGAQIYLDDVAVQPPYATTNNVIPDVPVGDHKVRVSLTGWIPTVSEQTVTVKSGEMATVTFTMVRPVTINVRTSPAGASIVLDGVSITDQTTPATFIRPRGLHTVSVSLTGYKPVSGSKNIIPPLTSWTFSWTLVPATNEIQGINVDSNPQGAAIYLDDEYAGADTPSYIGTSAEDHTVSVTLEGYEPAAWTGTVHSGEVLDVMLELTETGTVPVPEFPSTLVPLLSLLGLSLVVFFLKARKGS